jgi:PadR family transcriptional regulator, regulatory protein PadR
MALDDRVVAEAPAEGAPRRSCFRFTPPRHFVLPAILLLLSEEPSYGYRLVRDLEDLNFGRIDRPVVYRALGQLERDALVESWSEGNVIGRIRRVYALTPSGARVLGSWMAVIEQKRDALDGVLHRYRSTGSADGALVEFNG